MDSKNYTDVLINGKIYTLGGAERGELPPDEWPAISMKRCPGFSASRVSSVRAMIISL